MLIRTFNVISLIMLLAGCGSVAISKHPSSPVDSPAAHTPVAVRAPAPIVVREPDSAPEAPPPADLWERIRDSLSWQEIENRNVDKAVDHYLSQHGYMPMVSERSSLYLYYIVEEVQKRGMPMEIALIPLVESTMDPFSVSPNAAAGLWQIMPATGEHLGLQQDWWFDGRRSVRDSTEVALDYLEDLNQRFDGDWLLTLAAYNAGAGRVARAQQRNRERGLPDDYWSLELPRETRRYVPKVLALTQMIAEPESYDLDIPPVPNEPAFEVAETGGQIELAVAADLAQVDIDTLRELNPGQLRWATAPDRPPELLVPLGTAATLEASATRLTQAERVRWRYYRVRRGDNLGGIAKEFGTSVAQLRRANGINGSLIRVGQKLMIPSSDGWADSLASGLAGEPPSLNYQVRAGDSLHRIAGKYGVGVNDIISWNALDPRKYLQPGQKLTLYVKR
jgi:membrane-bound lytic murein transglycosylase D